MDPTTPLSELCVDRFEKLKEPLDGLQVQDWTGQNDIEVAMLCPESVRSLAAAFHRHLAREGYFETKPQRFIPTLQLSGLVSSKAFPRQMVPETISDVLDRLDDGFLSSIKRLDLRFCTLMDADAEDVKALCQRLANARAQNVVIDLTGNRFSPSSIPIFEDICSLHAIRFLVCPEIGHTGATSTLERARKLFFEKAIIILKHHLKGHAWRVTIPLQFQDVAEYTHEEYYKEFPLS